MNNRFKKILKILIILLVLLTILLMLWLTTLNKEKTNKNIYELKLEDGIVEEVSKSTTEKLKLVIEKYFTYLKDNVEIAYDLIDIDCIKKYDSKEKDIEDSMEFENVENNIKIEKVYEIQIKETFSMYIVYGKIKETNDEFNIIVNVDYSTTAFSIIPNQKMYQEYIKYDGNGQPSINNINELRKNYKSINKTAYNVF